MASLFRSAGIVALSTLCSRILGLVRDVLMAAYFGAARTADVFFIAFMIPNLFRRLVAEGALTISFIPVYTETRVNSGDSEADRLAVKVMTVQSIVIFIIVAAGIFFSPQLMYFFFGRGDSPHIFTLSVNLTRLMFPYLFFVGFVAFAMGYLNSHDRFFAPSFAPVLLNVGIITGIIFLAGFFEEPVYGVAAGVLLGGALQLFLQIPYMLKEGFRFGISVDFNHPGIRKIFRMLGPALFGIAVYQINTLVSNMLASMISEGSVSYIYYTNRLTELVLGIFIVSIGNVILPEMSKLTAVDDKVRFRKLFADSVSSALFLAVPATAGLITAGIPIISVIFMHGKFGYSDVLMTYNSLVCASAGIVFISALRIATPAFYSMKDTKTPVISATVALSLNLVLGYILMQTPLKHAGLTLANSISAVVQMLILLVMLEKKTGGIALGKILQSMLKFIIASLAMSAVVVWLSFFADWENSGFTFRVVWLSVIIGAGGGVYFLACYFMKADEVLFFVNRIKRRLT
ncbi:MAG TPA: murein biosynthesis integral membrane protein MurJ [Spirochaetota bacterium]|nr:murein biosynthesis integral membrane protein MurJ [Spirochaetota bacterium]HPJ33767.1 murein biosynthesis integral membrane protein MurJ [Spirochaetota bacterium]